MTIVVLREMRFFVFYFWSMVRREMGFIRWSAGVVDGIGWMVGRRGVTASEVGVAKEIGWVRVLVAIGSGSFDFPQLLVLLVLGINVKRVHVFYPVGQFSPCFFNLTNLVPMFKTVSQYSTIL